MCEQDVARTGERGYLGQRLQRADLVVGVHHRNQHRVWPQGPLELGQVQPAVAADRYPRDAEPEAGQSIEGRLGSRVFDRGGDDVCTALGGAQRFGGADECEMVALGARRGEHDLVRSARADQGGDLFTGQVSTARAAARP